MIRKDAMVVSVDDPSRGLVTRVPSNQPSKTTLLKGSFSVVSNMRFDDGVARNAPGFEEIWTHCWPEGTINLIFQEALIQGDNVSFSHPFICTAEKIYWIRRDTYDGTLLPCDIDSEESFGTPTISAPANLTVRPTGIGTNEIFGAQSVLGLNAISPTGVASSEAIGAATIANV